MFPTIADLCGITIPDHVEGYRLKNCIIKGEDPSKGAYIQFVHPFGKWSRSIGGREYRAIRTSRSTYVEDLNGPWFLYDNQKDPLQERNLANMPKYADLQEELKVILHEERKRVNDKFKPSKHYIQKWNMVMSFGGKIAGYKE